LGLFAGESCERNLNLVTGHDVAYWHIRVSWCSAATCLELGGTSK
jgi:hypothetical protein